MNWRAAGLATSTMVIVVAIPVLTHFLGMEFLRWLVPSLVGGAYWLALYKFFND